MQTHHGTVVDIAGVGVLLRGPSASGKSDLALRLMDRGATLVADDQFLVRSGSRGAIASAPDTLYGLLEVRGLGILSVPAIKTTPIRLIVDLVARELVPRLPEPTPKDMAGHPVSVIQLNAFEHSAPLKIELAATNLSRIGNTGDLKGRGRKD